MLNLHRDIQVYISTYLSKIDLQIISDTHSVINNTNICKYAAEHGYVSILQLYYVFKARGCRASDTPIGPIYDWHYTDDIRYELAENAATFGHQNILEFLFAQNCFTQKQKGSLFYTALCHARFKLSIWIYDSGCEIHGHIELPITCLKMLKWLYSKNIIKLLDVCISAIYYNKFKALEWAFIELPRSIYHNYNKLCAYAAKYNRLNILKWLRNKGCDWNSSTCRYSAERGNLEILQWALANGCPYDNSVKHFATVNKQTEVITWLEANEY